MKTKNLSLLRVIFLVALAGIFSGCSGNPVISAEKKDPSDDSPDPELTRVVVSGGLVKDIEVVGVKQGKVTGDLVKVQFNLRNIGKKPRRILYKVEWFDADGIMINDSSQLFQSQMIRAGEPVALQSVATTPLARNFRIKINAAKAN